MPLYKLGSYLRFSSLKKGVEHSHIKIQCKIQLFILPKTSISKTQPRRIICLVNLKKKMLKPLYVGEMEETVIKSNGSRPKNYK